MIENKINVYHGTDVKALPTILKHGLMTYKSAIDNNIDVSTGEMRWLLKKLKETYPDLNFAYPNFISLTDDFSVAKRYSIDSDVYAKIPLMLCMSENDLIKKYTKSIVNIKSNMTEIGVASDISLEDIKCFITTPQNADYVSQFIKDKNIPIFIYEPNKKLEFYDFKYNVDEEKFNIYREKIKYQLTIENIKNTNNQNNILSDDVHDYVQLGGKIR